MILTKPLMKMTIPLLSLKNSALNTKKETVKMVTNVSFLMTTHRTIHNTMKTTMKPVLNLKIKQIKKYVSTSKTAHVTTVINASFLMISSKIIQIPIVNNNHSTMILLIQSSKKRPI